MKKLGFCLLQDHGSIKTACQHFILPKSGLEAIKRMYAIQSTTTRLQPNNIGVLGDRAEKLGLVSAP